jgi:N-methylhydantoinase A/oxoprolinase/acetone carboxylase beta subunit
MILGIDVGGTHTDAVLIDRFKVLKKAKVVTNQKNFLASLLNVTNKLVDEADIAQLERVVLSTTISTNAIVQNKVDRVGLMVVSGPGLSPVLLDVQARGINIPIYILKADGGTFDIAQSVEFPVQTILSGPAASIMGILATTGCNRDAIALDIGGTTTDIAIFADGVPLFEAFGVTIENHKTLIRGLQTKSIGVGDDSVVRFREGKISIGPERIAVVDTDCHHGDGTQDIYWNDPDTLCISIHQDGRTLYPETGFRDEFGGLVMIESVADTGNSVFAVILPGRCCPECRNNGEMFFERTNRGKHVRVYFQDRERGICLVK